jgi:xylulokinase
VTRSTRATGNILDPHSSLPKILWFQQNQPDIYRRTAKFLQSKDYVAGCLTGVFDSTDFSDASHGQLLDLSTRGYIAEILRALHLDPDKLPRLYNSFDIIGALSASAAAKLGLTPGIPVVAGGGDGSCASIGARAVNAGDTYVCFGSSAWVASVSPTPIIDPQQRYFMIMALDGENFGVFGTVQSAGTSIAWAKDLFDLTDYAAINAAILEHSPSEPPVIFLPYLEGERSPIFDPHARGVLFGLSTAHTRSAMVTAVVEGVAFALKSVIESLRERMPIQGLNLIGGGAQLAALPPMLADVFGLPVMTLNTEAKDATSLGAAINAGVGVGMFRDFQDAVRAISENARYAPDQARTDAYQRRFAIYAALYPRLKTLFAQVQACDAR